jgi:hypothetical protein
MHMMSWLRGVALLVVLAGTALWGSATAAENQKGEGFTDLFNGRDLTGWKVFLARSATNAGPAKTFSVKDGMIICTGHPNGFLYTDKSYANYVLLYDWQYKRPPGLTDDKRFMGNSGCLVNIQNPDKPVMGGVWPECLEVQGMNRDHGLLLYIPRKAGHGTFDRAAKDKAVKPVGEWNTTEITCRSDGSVTAKINGIQVSSGKGTPTEGRIGLQSEGAEIHFRNIKLKPL